VKAVRFNRYGGIDVLEVADVPIPEPGQGEAQVRVKAASINPVEWKIRTGMLHGVRPTTCPTGEGTDLAGVVTKVGPGVSGIKVGDEVLGYTNQQSSHAEYAVAEAKNLTAKPNSVSWEAAGSLGIVGSTAYAAVRAVSLKPGDKVAVSGAAGGVGSIAVQLARLAGAEVIGIASPANHDWLTAHGVKPMAYGEGFADKLRNERINAFIDTHGDGYVQLAVELGLRKERINTIADFGAAQQYGVKAEGAQSVKSAAVLAELAGLIAEGKLEAPIAATYPLGEVRAAHAQLEKGHTRGKIVLLP
jgi:NADPH:quinone reductase-like Zn-dependent oxidoreductase